jgi:hypothetical protein
VWVIAGGFNRRETIKRLSRSVAKRLKRERVLLALIHMH